MICVYPADYTDFSTHKRATLMNNHMSEAFPVLNPGLNAVSWSGNMTALLFCRDSNVPNLSPIKEF